MVSTPDAGSLRRGARLLQLLANAGSRGSSLTELAERSGLPHPSAHRVLKQLLHERLAEHDPESHRYRLGPLTFELGLAGATLFDIRDLCEPAMRTLAEATGDTVYLVCRSGFDAVCMHRLEGSFPIRTLVLEIGSRRPLGVGAGGLAILSAMADEERRDVVQRVAPLLHAFGGLDAERLVASCERTRRAGYARIAGTVNLGVSAVGAAFRNTLGHPIGALSVAAMSQRMAPRRVADILPQLMRARDAVERQLRGQRGGTWRSGPVRAG